MDQIAMGDLIELRRNKIFTLKEARNLLPVVRKITQEAVEQVEILKAKIEYLDPEPAQRGPYEDELAAIVNRWTQKIVKLGCEPKGLWLVDFDSGEGYFCWRHPETELAYFHSYDETFAGRTPIL